MITEMLYTVNAGVHLSSGRTGLLIDGIHEGPSVGFSPMPDGLQEQLLCGTGRFSRLDGLLFTHLHKDHYDAEKVCRVMERRPQLALWGPELSCMGTEAYQVILSGCMFRIGDFRIEGYITTHSAEIYKKDPHRSFVINNEVSGERLLLYHRLLPEDDAYSYLPMICSTLCRYVLPGFEVEQPAHMQEVNTG